MVDEVVRSAEIVRFATLKSINVFRDNKYVKMVMTSGRKRSKW